MPLHCYNRRMSQPLFQLTGYRDDFGAIYIGGRGLPRESVLEWTRAGLEKIFTRVILDPARGLVMLMTPSQPHEDAEAGVEAVIEEGNQPFESGRGAAAKIPLAAPRVQTPPPGRRRTALSTSEPRRLLMQKRACKSKGRSMRIIIPRICCRDRSHTFRS